MSNLTNVKTPYSMVGYEESNLGWAYPYDYRISGKKPTNEFYQKLEQCYVEGLDFDYFFDDLDDLDIVLKDCFRWVPNFIESEKDDANFSYILPLIIHKFEKDESDSNTLSRYFLYKSLRNTLYALFNCIDKLSKRWDDELLYFKYMKSSLSIKNYSLSKDHLLFEFKELVLKELTIKKETFQEILTFNKISTGKKLSYESFNVQMYNHHKRNSGVSRFPDLKFIDLWNVEKIQVFKLLDDLIEANPEFGLQKIEDKYNYDCKQAHPGVKMAGFLVALSEGGWVRVFRSNLKSPIYDGKTLTRIINDFFNCDLHEKGEPFQKVNLDDLRDKLSLYPTRVEPILKIIGKNSL